MTAAILCASVSTTCPHEACASRTIDSLLEGAVLDIGKFSLEENGKLVGAFFLIRSALMDCRAGDKKGQGSIEQHFGWS